MEQKKLVDSVRIGTREFTFESVLNSETKEISTKISEHDLPLTRVHFTPQNGQTAGDDVKLLTEKHNSVIKEWELLFYIFQKVKSSNHPGSLNKMGLLLLTKNLIPEAIDCFNTAIRLNNRSVESYYNLGRAYIQAQIYPEAIEILSKAVSMEPGFVDVQIALGVAHLYAREHKEAVDVFERALGINPDNSLTHLMLAITYISGIVDKVDNTEMIPISLRPKRALAHLQKALDKHKRFDHPKIRQAIKEIQGKRFREAKQLLEDFLKVINLFEIKAVDEEFYLKFMFGGKSKDDTMIENHITYLQNQIKENPDYPDLHNNLGVVYLIKCRNMFLKAIEQFRTALKLNPSFTRAKKNLKLAENEGKGFIILLRALLK